MRIMIMLIAILFTPLAYSIDSEVNCLAKTIYYEARGESLKGQIAVALVTINRIKSDEFPDTVCSVVHEKGQFSWTSERYRITHIGAWNNSVSIAKQVLYSGLGKQILPGFTAKYFHSIKVKPRWRTKLRPQRIGNHIFY